MSFARIIAEVGQAHDGSLGIAHSYIDALSTTGVSAIKWQTHIAEAESSPYEQFRVNFSYQDKTRYDYWKRMEFTEEQWIELKSHCEMVGVEFISSPFSIQAVELLERLDVKTYKIGSGETDNFLLLDRIARTGGKVILSSGMSNYEELDTSVSFLKDRGVEIAILQCTTAYPTAADSWGLNVLEQLEQRYKLPIGFSDHSGTIYACLAAAALGAQIFEFHAVFDKRQFGPDSKASLSIDEIKGLVKGINLIRDALDSPIDKNCNDDFGELKRMFGKSLSLRNNKGVGETIEYNDLETKKPMAYGIPVREYLQVVGRRLSVAKYKGDFINWRDLQ